MYFLSLNEISKTREIRSLYMITYMNYGYDIDPNQAY